MRSEVKNKFTQEWHSGHEWDSENGMIFMTAQVWNECIEKSKGGLPYLTIFKFSCNNLATCDLLASLVTLDGCGGKSADYLHIDYYCKDGNFINLIYSIKPKFFLYNQNQK